MRILLDWLMQEPVNPGAVDTPSLDVETAARYNRREQFTPGELTAEETGLTLPEVATPDTLNAPVIRNIAQFITGLGIGGRRL